MSKILIVDDNPNNIQLLATVLSSNNYDIEYAESGYDAIDLFKDQRFDLVLMDVLMPGIDGFETTRIIKEKYCKRNIPFIFVTANTDTDSITKAFKLGGVDYITKPFNEAELLARVETHISLFNLRLQLQELNNTLEKKVEERTAELTAANIQLKGLDNAKNEFLDIISHEIRTPLNGIIGFSSLIKSSIDDENILPMFDYLEKSQKRLEDFSTKALIISDLRTKRENALSKDSINISTLIEQIYENENNKKEYKDKGIHFNTKIEEPVLFADLYFIKILFETLLINALKHSKPDSSIEVETYAENNMINIKINDGGNGFPEKILNSKSSYFVSEHIDNNPGLDLFLCQLIVHTHNGTMELYNDKGAVVKISMPALE